LQWLLQLSSFFLGFCAIIFLFVAAFATIASAAVEVVAIFFNQYFCSSL